MTEPVTRDLVDRTELHQRLAFEVEECAATEVGRGRRFGLEFALRFLDAMPSVEYPRGWTRDEVLHELDTHPGAVFEWQGPFTGEWSHYSRDLVVWHPEVRRYDVRVVLPEPPVTVWVPLTKLVGRTLPGETKPVEWIRWACGEWRWGTVRVFAPTNNNTMPLPVDLETGMVEVLAEGDA